MDAIFFFVFAGIAVLCAINLVIQAHPIASAISLVGVMGSLAALYLLLGGEFIAAVQVIVYAGAIMVLFLFVVMLLNAHREDEGSGGARLAGRPLVAGAVVAAVLVAELAWAFLSTRHVGGSWMAAGPETDGAALQSVRAVGGVLYSEYALAFEVTSLLIIVAMVGAVVLARRES